MSADALAELKEAGDGRYPAALKAALWSEWSFKIQTRTRCEAHSFSVLIVLYFVSSGMAAV
jgi:hypothetical protein